jgi:hypothetical protein
MKADSTRAAMRSMGNDPYRQPLLRAYRHRRLLDDHRRLVDVGREVGLVAEMTTAAHHRQVHAGTAALHRHGQDVDVARLADFLHGLPLEHGRQRGDLVAHRRRLLELQLHRVGFHLDCSFKHLGLAPLQEARGVPRRARSPPR